MEYRQLEYFVKVCETGSFSAAAKKLYITQQGLSKSIDKLERELGASLFARTRGGLSLTEAGAELYHHAMPHVEQWRHISKCVSKSIDSRRETLSIGFDVGTLEQYPVNFIPDFIKSHPEIDLSATCFLGAECRDKLINGAIDVGVSLPPVDEDLFDVVKDALYPLRVIVSKSHELASREAVRLRDLRGRLLVDINALTKEHRKLVEHCAEEGVFPTIVLNGMHWPFILSFCRNTNAVSFFGGSLEWIPDDIVALDITDASDCWGNAIIVRKHRYVSPALKQFIEYTKTGILKE